MMIDKRYPNEFTIEALLQALDVSAEESFRITGRSQATGCDLTIVT
jgi:hypothetical protein